MRSPGTHRPVEEIQFVCLLKAASHLPLSWAWHIVNTQLTSAVIFLEAEIEAQTACDLLKVKFLAKARLALEIMPQFPHL